MQRYEYDHAEPGERDPLDNPNLNYQSPPRQHYGYQQPHDYEQGPYQSQTPPYQRGGPRHGPGAQPGSSFNRLRAERRYSREQPTSSGGGPTPYSGAGVAASGLGYPDRDASPVSAPLAPQPPPHRDLSGPYRGREMDYNPNPMQSIVTPGADNFSEKASGGGMAGIAYGVAERNARQSGLNAMKGTDPQRPHREPTIPQQPDHAYGVPPLHGGGYYEPQPHGGAPNYPPNVMDRNSDSSLTPLGAAAMPPGRTSPSRSPHSLGNGDVYSDDPYQGYSRGGDPNLGVVNPNDIEDDGDEGLEYGRPARTSMLSLHSDRANSKHGAAVPAAAVAGGAAAGAAAGGVMGTIGGLVSRGHSRGASGNYGPVNNGSSMAYQGAAGSDVDLRHTAEKPSDWLAKDNNRRKRWKWLIIIVVVVLVAAGIGLGLYFGYFAKHDNGGESAAEDSSANGDLGINSAEIQKLLNNKNLHKVFPGIDYTPINTQYPDCLTNPPSQNNVTRDLAVLSQLTNTVRLYGTDCNQTEMVLHGISQLKMQDSLKVWLGVWQDNNATTNARQLAQMWDIIDKYGASQFKGVIVANEILFRQQMTVTQLGSLLSDVRTNLSSKGITMPVATSDLGDNWTTELAQASDCVMANIHPFFGGINADQAASWTWGFWEDHNSAFFKTNAVDNIISETGWPSQGGTDCGSDSVTNCPNGATAGISQMNKFMDDWVCSALANGTQYFWFEAFDEPWKLQFDTPGENWEDHWGLMDVNRNLKSGVQIPDCGGKTVS